MVLKTEIKRVTASEVEKLSELVAIEEPLEIRIGFGPLQEREQKSISVTMRTPGHDFELALGFLFTEQIVTSYEYIESIKYCENSGRQEEKDNVIRVELKPDVKIDFNKLNRHFYTSSSCGVCGKSSIDSVYANLRFNVDEMLVPVKVIQQLPDLLRHHQRTFQFTGGLHAAGLFDSNGKLVLMREDVGRHNALDKVIGAKLFESKIPLSKIILLVSGRTSFELIQKAAVAGIPIVAAIGAPSSLAVNLAKTCGITLIGFIREGRFNVYANPHRIDSANLVTHV